MIEVLALLQELHIESSNGAQLTGRSQEAEASSPPGASTNTVSPAHQSSAGATLVDNAQDRSVSNTLG